MIGQSEAESEDRMEYKSFKIDPEKLSVPDFYDSPFNMIVDKISADIAKQTDEMVYSAVQKVGITVDKDKLVSALQQDMQRYRDAYTRGYMDAMGNLCNAFNHVFNKVAEESLHHFMDSFNDALSQVHEGETPDDV